MSTVRLLRSVTGVWPKSAHKMGHRLPLDFCRSWSRSRKVLLWRLVLLRLAVNPSLLVYVCLGVGIGTWCI
jgi:hypothetical protein